MTKTMWEVLRGAACVATGFIAKALGGLDGMLTALIVFMVCDYATGVMCAIKDRKLSSAVGFLGIGKKVLILVMVGIANVIDTNITQTPGTIRTMAICFYAANEGLSIIENMTHMGLPVPEGIKNILAQLHDRANKEIKTDEIIERNSKSDTAENREKPEGP